MATGNGTGHLGAALLAMVPGLLAAVSAQAGNTIAVTVGPRHKVLDRPVRAPDLSKPIPLRQRAYPHE